MKKLALLLTTAGLMTAMGVTALADQNVSFSDTQPLQVATTTNSKLFGNFANGETAGVINSAGNKDSYFTVYNGYIYYLDTTNSGYIDLKRSKLDKTEDTFVYRIVTGESYSLDSYIMGDSRLYYTVCNIKTQKYSVRMVDLVSGKDTEIYSEDYMLDVLASSDKYVFVTETTFDNEGKLHRLVYKVNSDKPSEKYVAFTTKKDVSYTNATIYGSTLYMLRHDFSKENQDAKADILVYDVKYSRLAKTVSMGSANVVDVKNGYAFTQENGTITKVDLTTGAKTKVLNIDGSKLDVCYLGYFNGNLYYSTYNATTFKNEVYSKNVTGNSKTLLSSWTEKHIQ